eukprot:scaffold21085_cov44-Phaeocystis_antarctica.AAC.1
MVVTLDVSKLSGWLNADAPCRDDRRAFDAGRGAGREAIGCGKAAAQAARTGPTECLGPWHARRAHVEHPVHVRDAGCVPTGNVRVEILQVIVIVIEEPAHVGDGRDVPVGDGAVRRFGRGHVGVVRLDRRLQCVLG